VSSYRIFADDASVGEVSGTTTAFQVTGLTGGRRYRFSVQAQDTDGNWSDDGPVLELTTPTSGVIADNAPPTWPGGRLTATEITQNSVHLHWQGAVDSGTGVVAYRVFRVGPALEGQVPADQDSFQVTGLASGTFYRFFVQAGDALGHWSTDGPSIVIRTELDPNTGSPALVYTLTVGGDEQTNQTFSELSRLTFGRSFQAPDPESVVDSLLEIIQQVTDTTPPVLDLPRDLVVESSTCQSEPVTFAASATDDVDGVVPVVCDPPSGSAFSVGTTVVTCRATDAAGNTAEGSFRVTVRCRRRAPLVGYGAAALSVAALFLVALRSLRRGTGWKS
jgi:chitodextrinase